MPRHTNRFFKGQNQGDVDTNLAGANGYIYALNGRIAFNEPDNLNDDANITPLDGGAMLAFVNERGNKEVWTFCNNMKPCGFLDIGDECVVFLQGGGTSEIGVFTVNPLDDSVTYVTLFNDDNDPNGDRLAFSNKPNLRVGADNEKESEGRRRVYFTDNKNEPSVFNLDLAYDENGDPYAVQDCGEQVVPYPWWFSVHQFRLRPDVAAGDMVLGDYETNASAATKTGIYRFTFQYQTRDGHLSHFHPTTPMFFVTTESITGNYLELQMSPSNIDTQYRMYLNLDILDTRFWKIRLVFQYSINSTDIFESYMFREEIIDPATFPGTLAVWFDKHSGTPIDKSVFTTDYEWFKKAPALSVFRSKLIIAAPETFPQPDVPTATVQITTLKKLVNNDKLKAADIINAGAGNVNYPFNTHPMIAVDTSNSGYKTRAYIDSGAADVFRVIGGDGLIEYPNYKGPCFTGYFKGYFRGETYPFGLLLFDKKMRPLYVVDIQDYTFENQYDSGFGLTALDAGSGTYQVRILGISLDKIQIPQDVVFDANGEQQIAAFSIVRMLRKPKLRAQGIVMNTVWAKEGGFEKYTHGHPAIISDYIPNPGGVNAALNTVLDLRAHPGGVDKWFARPNTCMFYSPDTMIEQSLGLIGKDDYFKIVGTANHDIAIYGDTKANWAPYCFPVTAGGGNYETHFWGKFYRTSMLDKRGVMGKKFRINKASLISEYSFENGASHMTIKEYDPDNLLLEFDALHNCRMNVANFGNDNQKGAANPRWGALIKSKEASLVDVSDTANSIYYAYHIANLETPQETYYDTDVNSSRRYVSTGHFQPLSAAVLADVPTVTDADGRVFYEFNGVEVWGGDCYAALWDFTPNVPWYYDDCDPEGSGEEKDMSVSMIVPIESKYNFPMRYGRSFVKDAVFPELVSCGGAAFSGIYYKGVNLVQQPDWNVNACLQYEETLRFYPNKPPSFEVITQMSGAIYYSNQKTAGEKSDQYRNFLPLNFGLVQGVHGAITSLHRLFDSLYCLQQKGLSSLRINVRTAIATTQGEITTGTGKDFDGAEYITTIYGCQDRFGATTIGNQLHFVDSVMRSFCRHGANGLDLISNSKNFHSLAWTSLKGFEYIDKQDMIVQVIPDYRNLQVIYSMFLTDFELNLTFAFDENLNALDTRWSYNPDMLIYQGKYVLSSKQDVLYLHQAYLYGNYYGEFSNTKLRFVVTGETTSLQKVFDNMLISVNPDGVPRIGKVTLTTDTGQVHSLDLRSDTRVMFRDNLLRFPLFEVGNTTGRLRGLVLQAEIEIMNDDQIDDETDIRTIITAVYTDYRVTYKR